MAPRFVARQLAKPTGLGGQVIAFLMNRGNATLNAYALDQLELKPDDAVLEIGFGGGVALRRLIPAVRRVCGVDRSADVVKWAGARFGSAVDAGRAEFKVGAVEALPASTGAFDKVLSVNTVYFWTSLAAGASEIRRVLAPGGRVALGFVPKSRMDRMNMPADIFSPREPQAILNALAEAGFTDVELRSSPVRSDWLVAVARQAPA